MLSWGLRFPIPTIHVLFRVSVSVLWAGVGRAQSTASGGGAPAGATQRRAAERVGGEATRDGSEREAGTERVTGARHCTATRRQTGQSHEPLIAKGMKSPKNITGTFNQVLFMPSNFVQESKRLVKLELFCCVWQLLVLMSCFFWFCLSDFCTLFLPLLYTALPWAYQNSFLTFQFEKLYHDRYEQIQVNFPQ